MSCSCSKYNAHSNLLIVGHYSFVMPTPLLKAFKNKVKSNLGNKQLIKHLVLTGKSQILALPN